MGDETLRKLERRWKQTGAVADEARWLEGCVRAGELEASRLELMAYCGHPAAKRAQKGVVSPTAHRTWIKGLEAFGHEACVLAAYVIACESAEALPGDTEEKQDMLATLRAIHGWLRAPGPKTRKAVKARLDDGSADHFSLKNAARSVGRKTAKGAAGDAATALTNVRHSDTVEWVQLQSGYTLSPKQAQATLPTAKRVRNAVEAALIEWARGRSLPEPSLEIPEAVPPPPRPELPETAADYLAALDAVGWFDELPAAYVKRARKQVAAAYRKGTHPATGLAVYSISPPPRKKGPLRAWFEKLIRGVLDGAKIPYDGVEVSWVDRPPHPLLGNMDLLCEVWYDDVLYQRETELPLDLGEMLVQSPAGVLFQEFFEGTGREFRVGAFNDPDGAPYFILCPGDVSDPDGLIPDDMFDPWDSSLALPRKKKASKKKAPKKKAPKKKASKKKSRR